MNRTFRQREAKNKIRQREAPGVTNQRERICVDVNMTRLPMKILRQRGDESSDVSFRQRPFMGLDANTDARKRPLKPRNEQ
jgi:hypothetical protein